MNGGCHGRQDDLIEEMMLSLPVDFVDKKERTYSTSNSIVKKGEAGGCIWKSLFLSRVLVRELFIVCKSHKDILPTNSVVGGRVSTLIKMIGERNTGSYNI